MGREMDAYRGRWRGSKRAWAWRRWTSSREGVAGGAADGAGGQAHETVAGGSPAGMEDAEPPRAGSSSDGGRHGTANRGGTYRSTALHATQQQRGGAERMRRGGGGAGPHRRGGAGVGPRWLRGAGAEGRGGSGTAPRATQQRQGGAGPAHRGSGGAGRPARRWGASERDQRESVSESES
ncbi:spidroin-1-like [Panicum virgatum]|uniref:spidroin-1-like n=1 Tax=Panicum virgatum TaxID=38727 RepID=UPI0019D59DCA|nr:spidroin-1-like [Panicum virgatum]